jgi:hypothetical protein
MLNDSRLVAECFDTQKRPGGHVLCAMTFAQVEKSVLDAVKVGARCQLESNKLRLPGNLCKRLSRQDLGRLDSDRRHASAWSDAKLRAGLRAT